MGKPGFMDTDRLIIPWENLVLWTQTGQLFHGKTWFYGHRQVNYSMGKPGFMDTDRSICRKDQPDLTPLQA